MNYSTQTPITGTIESIGSQLVHIINVYFTRCIGRKKLVIPDFFFAFAPHVSQHLDEYSARRFDIRNAKAF